MRRKLAFTVIIIASAVLCVLVIWSALQFVIGKPRPTIDYAVEYNRLTKPADYDPNLNAAADWQKAMACFVEVPNDLRFVARWPADFNDTKQAILTKWLQSNQEAIGHFTAAAEKPYCWVPAPEGTQGGLIASFPNILLSTGLTDAVISQAMNKAFQGDANGAFETILALYRASIQNHRQPSLLIGQLVGIIYKKHALSTALTILDRTDLEAEAIEKFARSLSELIAHDTYVPHYTADRLYFLDGAQRTFVNDGKGTGKLSWRGAPTVTANSSTLAQKMSFFQCLFGPTEAETIEQYDETVKLFDEAISLTPWQIQNSGARYFEDIVRISESNLVLESGGNSKRKIYYMFHNLEAEARAVTTIAAILAFKKGQERWPANLGELLENGYITALPDDPYSEGALVYTSGGDNFKLYSVGQNFKDDGGSNEVYSVKTDTFSMFYNARFLDFIFWPLENALGE